MKAPDPSAAPRAHDATASHARAGGATVMLVGLGKMGGNMAARWLRAGHHVVAYDRSAAAREAAAAEGARVAQSLEQGVAMLPTPRIVWLMLPSGAVTEGAVAEVSALLGAGDVLLEGGNSRHTDSVRRAQTLAQRGIRFLDVGTSGGVWGLSNGYCLMVGGEREAVRAAEPLLSALTEEGGFRHVGPSGAGHFAKMVHNAIEYGMMQAYAEGFELLRKSEYAFDLAELARLWGRGSVIRSWLLELVERALRRNPDLDEIAPAVADSGEGRWALEEAVMRGVPSPALAAALFVRFASRDPNSYAGRMLAALRNEFGGHAVERA
jgi:6-phosphogluconate dehydrogenase